MANEILPSIHKEYHKFWSEISPISQQNLFIF